MEPSGRDISRVKHEKPECSETLDGKPEVCSYTMRRVKPRFETHDEIAHAGLFIDYINKMKKRLFSESKTKKMRKDKPMTKDSSERIAMPNTPIKDQLDTAEEITDEVLDSDSEEGDDQPWLPSSVAVPEKRPRYEKKFCSTELTDNPNKEDPVLKRTVEEMTSSWNAQYRRFFSNLLLNGSLLETSTEQEDTKSSI